MYLCMYIYVCVYAYTHIHVRAHTHACMHAHKHIYNVWGDYSHIQSYCYSIVMIMVIILMI